MLFVALVIVGKKNKCSKITKCYALSFPFVFFPLCSPILFTKFLLKIFTFFNVLIRWNGKILSMTSSHFVFCYFAFSIVLWLEISNLSVSQYPRECSWVLFPWTDSGLSIYHYGQISISCTISCGLAFLPSLV